jgi:hypothetical protein
MLVRCCVVVVAAALAGCVSSGYSGGNDYYPGEAYYGGPYGPYYGGGLGYDPYFDDYDDDYDRYFHPAHNVTCDRARDTCYDRYGVSYDDTARYLGEREANRAYHKYGDKVFLFSPQPGVTCDRRTQECSNGHWPVRVHSAAPDGLRRIEPGNKGSIGSGSRFADQGEPVWPVAPSLQNNDKAVTKHVSPPVEAQPMAVQPQRLGNNGDTGVARPSAKATSDDSNRPNQRPILNSGDKPGASGGGNGGGNACPPLGCK